ncbi:MAG TPA: nitroreductase [Syntrophales bacterium]|nr:nitroreductase [Syntrophales bacterium]HOL60191.1 nitroreductase [Syntrophales bacterium]HPO36317.1 nitroreductase [Syntrophales bacterium]
MMTIVEAIEKRRSIRAYQPTPVPKEVVKEILSLATRAPSGMNTQPWEFFVVTGRILETIREENTRLFSSGVLPTLEVIRPPFTGIYRERQVKLAKDIFRLMGIAREDREKRQAWMTRGVRYFDAPVAIIVCTDQDLTEPLDLLGIGALLQTLCLAALNYGLGTCIADQGILYPEVWRQYAGIPTEKKIVAGLALGYPDDAFPANLLSTEREPVDNITTWVGWDY